VNCCNQPDSRPSKTKLSLHPQEEKRLGSGRSTLSNSDLPRRPLDPARDKPQLPVKSSPEAKKLLAEKPDSERAREQKPRPASGVHTAKTQPYIHALLLEPTLAREREQKDCLVQLQSEKLFGDNLMEIFKKKKVSSAQRPCEFLASKPYKLSSPLQQKPSPQTEVVPEHFRARLSQQQPASHPGHKKAQVERILTDLLEEHKSSHKPETGLFSKLHFIEKAISSIHRLYSQHEASRTGSPEQDSSPLHLQFGHRGFGRSTRGSNTFGHPQPAKHSESEATRHKHLMTEALNSRSSKSISYTEEQKASLNNPDFYHKDVFKTCRDIHRKREATHNSYSNFSGESAQLADQRQESAKQPSKKICLKKYNDIISEIDNMKMKISRISRELPAGLSKQ